MIQKTQFKAGSMLAIIRLRRYEEQDTSSNVFLSWVYTLYIYMFILGFDKVLLLDSGLRPYCNRCHTDEIKKMLLFSRTILLIIVIKKTCSWGTVSRPGMGHFLILSPHSVSLLRQTSSCWSSRSSIMT